MIVYLWDEPGADRVEERLEDHSELCLVHAINLCDVYYKARRLTDEGEVFSAIQDLKA